MSFKVKATKDGIYGKYRKAGDVFDVADSKALSSNWMKVMGEQSPVVAPVAAPVNTPVAHKNIKLGKL